MAWLKYIALIVLVHVSYGADDDIFCYSKKFGDCSKTVQDLCSVPNQLASCISNSALSCSMQDDKDVKSITSYLNDKLCKDGTPENKRYKDNWQCIKDSTQSQEMALCLKDISDAIAELNKKKLSVDDLLKASFGIVCKFNDTYTRCTQAEMNKKCGKDAVSLIVMEQSAGLNQLSKRLCDYVNGVSRNTFQVSMWVLQAAALLFIFKWSSY